MNAGAEQPAATNAEVGDIAENQSAPEPRAAEDYLDAELWARLSKAQTGTAQEFARAWLDAQCAILSGVVRGVAVLGEPDTGPFNPVAQWPEDSATSESLAAAAELAMAERRGAVRTQRGAATALMQTDASAMPSEDRSASEPASNQESEPAPLHAIAWPLLVNDHLCGVVAVEVLAHDENELRAVMRQLQWGCGGLKHILSSGADVETTPNRSLAAVMELVATCLEHPQFQAAATASVTEVATSLAADWACIGFRRGAHTRVAAFSHSAEFQKKSNFIRAIGLAMDEAIDQHTVIMFPPPEGPARATRAHAELARETSGSGGAVNLVTVPLSEGQRILGALTVARAKGTPFSHRESDLLRQAGLLVGPVLDAKRRDERWLIRKAWDSLAALATKLVGPRHAALKLWAIALVAAIAYLWFAEGEFRVTADASLEGAVQRVVAAPIDGYVNSTAARAGDVVERGDVLAMLDARDLTLERLRWVNQREEKLREYSAALAQHNRAEVRIVAAQLDQAEAQIELLDERIARTRIQAPISGIVISGDLSQSMGAPVERGEVLFEIAPLDDYRVMLKVDERDITQIQVGQSGELALASLPGETIPLSIQKITPVAVAEEGRNAFNVEAHIKHGSGALRPGMEGVAKIDIDRRKKLWLWTYKLVDWARMWWWTWRPA